MLEWRNLFPVPPIEVKRLRHSILSPWFYWPRASLPVLLSIILKKQNEYEKEMKLITLERKKLSNITFQWKQLFDKKAIRLLPSEALCINLNNFSEMFCLKPFQTCFKSIGLGLIKIYGCIFWVGLLCNENNPITTLLLNDEGLLMRKRRAAKPIIIPLYWELHSQYLIHSPWLAWPQVSLQVVCSLMKKKWEYIKLIVRY